MAFSACPFQYVEDAITRVPTHWEMRVAFIWQSYSFHFDCTTIPTKTWWTKRLCKHLESRWHSGDYEIIVNKMVDIASFFRLEVLEIGQKILRYTFVRRFEEYLLQSLFSLLDGGFLYTKQGLDFLV